ncbi:MAG: L,D-transpeptidase family protein [Hyphomicrobium sp.]
MSGDRLSHTVRRGVRSGALLLSVSALVLTGSIATSEFARARKKPQAESSFFGFLNDPPPRPRNYRVYNQRPSAVRSKENKAAAKEPAPVERPVKGPLVLSVSLARQKVTVHDIDGPIAEAPISSGTPAFPTFTGVFTILEKSVVHHSNIYAGAPMPNMQRLTWSGTAMHAGHLPGYPASHGCIRLPYNFSKKLYGMTKLGTRVIVSRDPVVPVRFAHDNLIAPLPPEQTTAGLIPAETKVAETRDYETVRSLALVSTASAAEPAVVTGSTAPSEPLTGYRAKRAAEKQQTEEALKTAEAAKLEAELSAKTAVQASDAAKAAAKLARIESERLAQDARKVEQARIEADRALEAFSRKYAGAKSIRADQVEQAAKAEEELENKSFEIGRELETAREAAAKAKAASVEADAAVLAAVNTVKQQAQALSKVNQDMATAKATLDSFRRQELVRKHPVSVLISRSAGRLYVRQGYEPIFDVPVTIKDPDVAIGTHVFTAIELTGPTSMTWSASSMPYNVAPPADPKKKKKNAQYDVRPVSAHLPQTPESALDRVSIPEEARERIADVMKPGSSIIVSDYGISHQTGKFTDFIIMTR